MAELVGRIDWGSLLGGVLEHALRIAVVLGVAWVANMALRRIVPRLVEAAVRKEMEEHPEEHAREEEFTKRYETLSAVIIRTGQVLVSAVAFFTILAELGIPIAPILASAGIAGIAVGFGAQSLVKDVISGVFILLENQYRKGDVVRVAGVGGLVEEVNLRRTVLRDLDGVVHTIPNGEITVSSNFTKGWSRVNINVGVAYDTDMDTAKEVIDRVGQEMAQDPYFGDLIIEAPHWERVDAFEDSGVAIKILGVTKPIRQWEVMGELRKRLLKAFAEAGIEIPYAHRVTISRPLQASEAGPPPDAPQRAREQREHEVVDRQREMPS